MEKIKKFTIQRFWSLSNEAVEVPALKLEENKTLRGIFFVSLCEDAMKTEELLTI